MPRPTSAQIDAEIVETAAALFATHGYERTSVQQVADAVGYSKTGLLHRFASKDALLRAAADATVAAITAVTADVVDLPPGPARDARAVAGIARLALRGPGRLSLALGLSGSLTGTASGDRLAEVPPLLARCFDVHPDDTERQVRVTAALAVLAGSVVDLPDLEVARDPELVRRIAVDILAGQLHPMTRPDGTRTAAALA